LAPTNSAAATASERWSPGTGRADRVNSCEFQISRPVVKVMTSSARLTSSQLLRNPLIFQSKLALRAVPQANITT
jgi:hypothetical protein